MVNCYTMKMHEKGEQGGHNLSTLSIFSKGLARHESSHTMAHRQWWLGAPCLLSSGPDLQRTSQTSLPYQQKLTTII